MRKANTKPKMSRHVKSRDTAARMTMAKKLSNSGNALPMQTPVTTAKSDPKLN